MGYMSRYDKAYLDMYPYLRRYLPSPSASAASVLEIGLGYGTVAQALSERGWRCCGLDLANGPRSRWHATDYGCSERATSRNA